MTHPPRSGTQHELGFDDYGATVASVGATLRALTHRGRDLVVRFDADELRPTYRGTTLAPWPNRVVDGRYTFRGQSHRLPLTEPERAHALHGLVAWSDFAPVEVSDSAVTLRATIEPQAGYPWRVAVETTYSLGPLGLTQAVRGTNLSPDPAPWGTGPHPYLVAGDGPLDEWILQLSASHVLGVTDQRLVPVRLDPVDAATPERFDFRSPRAIGTAEIDHAYTGMARSDDGLARVRLTTGAGAGVALSWDTACPWVQIHTADLPGDPSRPGHRAGLAVEPMTCAPDAFNAGSYEHDVGLIVLEPGGSAEASWTVSAITGSDGLRGP